jgi:phosphoglycerol transferase MdoB-like AlkP superfamily enzyme
MTNISEFANTHPFLLAIIIIWLLIWKGLVLWKSAKRNNIFWFMIFLVLNTLSVGEIIYYVCIKIKERKEKIEIK